MEPTGLLRAAGFTKVNGRFEKAFFASHQGWWMRAYFSAEINWKAKWYNLLITIPSLPYEIPIYTAAGGIAQSFDISHPFCKDLQLDLDWVSKSITRVAKVMFHPVMRGNAYFSGNYCLSDHLLALGRFSSSVLLRSVAISGGLSSGTASGF